MVFSAKKVSPVVHSSSPFQQSSPVIIDSPCAHSLASFPGLPLRFYTASDQNWSRERPGKGLGTRLHTALCTRQCAQAHLHKAVCTRQCAQGSVHKLTCTRLCAQAQAVCTRQCAQGSVHKLTCTRQCAQAHLHKAVCTSSRAHRLCAQGSVHKAGAQAHLHKAVCIRQCAQGCVHA